MANKLQARGRATRAKRSELHQPRSFFTRASLSCHEPRRGTLTCLTGTVLARNAHSRVYSLTARCHASGTCTLSSVCVRGAPRCKCVGDCIGNGTMQVWTCSRAPRDCCTVLHWFTPMAWMDVCVDFVCIGVSTPCLICVCEGACRVRGICEMRFWTGGSP